MTREVCEDRLLALLERAEEIYREYDPYGEGLSLSSFDGQLDVMGFGGDIGATLFPDGTVRRWNGKKSI